MIKANKHIYPNGLTLITVPMPDSPTATVMVMVGTGSAYEKPGEEGISHFLEHMSFKKTPSRPSAYHITREFDSLGASYNAFTDFEMTAYYAKVASKDAEKALDLIADIYRNSVFTKEDLDKERGVILEEINMYNGRPEHLVSELFTNMMHGNQPSGLSILGTKESVSSFGTEDFYRYKQAHYVPSATTVVLSGAVDAKKARASVARAFANFAPAKKRSKIKTKISSKGPMIKALHRDIEQLHLVLGARSFPYGDKRNTAISVLRGVLAGGLSSRLSQKMREELGICYYVRAGNSPAIHHGEFSVVSGVDPKRADVAVEAIIDEIKKLKADKVPKDELEMVKSAMVSRMYMALELSDDVAEYFGHRALFHGDLLSPKEKEKAIKSITSEDVLSAARALFKGGPYLALVGNKPDTDSLGRKISF